VKKPGLYIIFFLFVSHVFAQELPGFKLLRYEEDYSFLQKESVQKGYKNLKFIPLSEIGNTYLSLGGDVRFQYFYSKNEDWGDAPEDKDGYVLNRFLFHADFHAGTRFRAFVQLQSSNASGRINPSPLDENPLDLHQGFIDFNPITSDDVSLTLRVGRQELLYGSQRLVAVREGPNVRQSFDAARAILTSEKYKTELLYGYHVALYPGIFDNRHRGTKLWGAYLTRTELPVVKNMDLYYLGIQKEQATFNNASGEERRHSVGTRLWSSTTNWNYDLEALYQFGEVGNSTISAWTASINTSYTFNQAKFSPELGLKTEIISGDKNKNDGQLQTFNPLFPKGAYFGLAALIGPSNLMDIHPSLSLNFTQNLSWDIDYDMFWRHSVNDGLYAVNVELLYPDNGSNAKWIGNQLTNALMYYPNNHLSFRYELTWFQAGDYLKEVGSGKDIIFTGVTAQIKF
jgi:hypothetical protein